MNELCVFQCEQSHKIKSFTISRFRCHQNDIENVFPFVLVGSFYVATDPDPWWAAVLFRTFVISRCLHTVCYLTPVPQPSRFLACMTGWGVTAVMAALVIRAGRV